MPRNSAGVYTLPSGNPVVTSTLISSSWANPTMSDIGNELTNSLDRSGRGSMLAPFKNVDGTVSLPGMTWGNEPSTGFYRKGVAVMGVTLGAVEMGTFQADGFHGNVTGNVIGDIVGNVTGHASLDLALTGGSMTGTIIGAGSPAVPTFAQLRGTGSLIEGTNLAASVQLGFLQFNTASTVLHASSAAGLVLTTVAGGLTIDGTTGNTVALGGLRAALSSDNSIPLRVINTSGTVRLSGFNGAAGYIDSVNPSEAAFAPLAIGGSTLDLRINGASAIAVTAASLVGLGRAPGVKLDILGVDNVSTTEIVRATSLNLAQSTSLTFAGLKANAGLAFIVNNATTAIQVDTTGSVGIGKAPGVKVDILGLDNVATTEIVKASSNNGAQTTSLTFAGLKANAGAGLTFYVNNGTSALTLSAASAVDIVAGTGKLTIGGQPTIFTGITALTSGTAVYGPFTHTNNRIPTMSTVTYVCAVANSGYSVGDEGQTISIPGTGATVAVSSATQTWIVQSSNPTMLNKASGASFVPAPANFNIVVRNIWL